MSPGASGLPSAAGPSIQVVTSGKPPRRVLRWDLRKGSRETLDIDMDMTQTVVVAGDSGPAMKLALLHYEVTVETTGVTPDGTAHVEFKIANAEAIPGTELSPRVADLWTQGTAGVKGMGGTYSVDSRGVVRNVQAEVPAEATGPVRTRVASIQQLLHRTTVPLPEEEVGPGAKWTVRRVAMEGGVRIEQLSTVELTKLKGSRMDVDLNIEKTGVQQKVPSPRDQMSSPEHLLKLESTETGQLQYDLTKIVQRSSKIKRMKKITQFVPGPGGTPVLVVVNQDTVEAITGK